MKYGDKYIGITSGHVDRPQMVEFDSICGCGTDSVSGRYVDDRVDVSFFTFADFENHASCLFNLLPMNFALNRADVLPIVGEPVYKVARSTGLTIGTLGSLQITLRSGYSCYTSHVQVIWNNELNWNNEVNLRDQKCRFAFSMDCGSLYCVKRGDMFYPIAVHRISGEGVSYGCSFTLAVDYFEGYPETLNFVNPPFLAIKT